MASWTRWTWVWVNSGSWWWAGRPGMLRFMGSQRVGHDWATDLIWSEASLVKMRNKMYIQGGGNYWGSILTPNFIATVKPSPALLRVNGRKSGLWFLSSYMLVHLSAGVDLCLKQTPPLSSSNPDSGHQGMLCQILEDCQVLPSFFTFFSSSLSFLPSLFFLFCFLSFFLLKRPWMHSTGLGKEVDLVSWSN